MLMYNILEIILVRLNDAHATIRFRTPTKKCTVRRCFDAFNVYVINTNNNGILCIREIKLNTFNIHHDYGLLLRHLGKFLSFPLQPQWYIISTKQNDRKYFDILNSNRKPFVC